MKSLRHPVAICGLGVIGCVVYLTVMVLSGCAGNQAHVQNEAEAIKAGCDYAWCTAKVKLLDGGTMRDWQKCACEYDAVHHVDSGKCAP